MRNYLTLGLRLMSSKKKDPPLTERIANVRTLLADCTVLVDELELALTSAESIFPAPEVVAS